MKLMHVGAFPGTLGQCWDSVDEHADGLCQGWGPLSLFIVTSYSNYSVVTGNLSTSLGFSNGNPDTTIGGSGVIMEE